MIFKGVYGRDSAPSVLELLGLLRPVLWSLLTGGFLGFLISSGFMLTAGFSVILHFTFRHVCLGNDRF